jgi:hypothetical protein
LAPSQIDMFGDISPTLISNRDICLWIIKF